MACSVLTVQKSSQEVYRKHSPTRTLSVSRTHRCHFGNPYYISDMCHLLALRFDASLLLSEVSTQSSTLQYSILLLSKSDPEKCMPKSGRVFCVASYFASLLLYPHLFSESST